jgi:hypothetical protein
MLKTRSLAKINQPRKHQDSEDITNLTGNFFGIQMMLSIAR